MVILYLLFVGILSGLAWAWPHRHEPKIAFERFYVAVVFVAIGFNGIFFGFIPHVFFADYIATKIGWPTGSPFQFEVGVSDGCWGLLGFLSARYKQGFLQATTIGWSAFLIIAGANHLKETVMKGNYAPYNFQFIAGDLIPAAVFLLLAWKYSHRAIENR
jgi:hypothetical protein